MDQFYTELWNNLYNNNYLHGSFLQMIDILRYLSFVENAVLKEQGQM